MAIYGIGEAFKQGVQGFNEGRQFVDEADARQQQLEQNRMLNEARKIELDQKARDNQDLLTFRESYGDVAKNAQSNPLASPLFSAQTNENAAGLAAAKATGNPALIARYTQAYDEGWRTDLSSETVSVLNQAKNADSADITRVNAMYKARDIPVQIIRAGNGEVVAEGPNGLRTFTVQGFLNEAARVLNPANAYSNIATQMSNEAQIAADRATNEQKARFDFAKSQQDQAEALEKQRVSDEAAMARTVYTGDRSVDAAREMAKQRQAVSQSNETYREKVLEQNEREMYIKNSDDKNAAAKLRAVEYRYHAKGESPASIFRVILQQNPDMEKAEIFKMMDAAGVNKPRRTLMPFQPPQVQ